MPPMFTLGTSAHLLFKEKPYPVSLWNMKKELVLKLDVRENLV